MVFGLCACSTDNDDDLNRYQKDFIEKSNTAQEASAFGTSYPSCFTSLTGRVYVDVSNGFGNPTVVFVPIISGSVSFTARFWVRVEVQGLSDCDNFSSNSGTVLTFGPTEPVQNVVSSPPSVWVSPGSMPLCYKWRFVFEGISSNGSKICTAYSKWSESPLF